MRRLSNLLKVVSLVAILLVFIQNIDGASVSPSAELNDDNPEYWIERKKEFIKETKFELTFDNLKLLGPNRLIAVDKYNQPSGHLPFWFDYELFKKVFNKHSASENENRQRHHIYINTCVRTLKARTLFRMLAGTEDSFITSDADKVSVI